MKHTTYVYEPGEGVSTLEGQKSLFPIRVEYIAVKEVIVIMRRVLGENRDWVDYEKYLETLEHGHSLFCLRNPEVGYDIHYFLKKIFMHKYGVKYSANHKVKTGEELIISNFPIDKETLKKLPK